MRKTLVEGMCAMFLVALSGFAQQAPAGAVVTASSPGKVAMAETVKASAKITAIDKATRTVTLKTADGRSFDVVAGDDVKNFDQVKAGDRVVVQYVRALTLEVKKAGSVRERTESTDAVRAETGGKPGAAVGRQVTIIANVIGVNPKKKTITLKGPKGNIVELDVENPDHFKVVKKGDQVEAVYTEAVAVAVVPAAKKGAKN